MPDADEVKKKKHDLIKKEMARRANDEIKVHNPTMKTYYVKWGGNYWKVPARTKDSDGHGKGNTVLPRYIASRYIEQMVNFLIMEEIIVDLRCFIVFI